MLRSIPKPSRRKLFFTLSALSIVGVATGAVAAVATANEPPSKYDYHIKVIQNREVNEILPYQITESDNSLQKDTLRALATHDGAQYWAGLDQENNLCLVALFGSKDWVSGQSCTTPEIFTSRGLGLRLYGPEGIIEAYLVPDDETAGGVVHKVTSNLYVADPYASGSERSAGNSTQATSTSPADFNLAVFDQPFSIEAPK